MSKCYKVKNREGDNMTGESYPSVNIALGVAVTLGLNGGPPWLTVKACDDKSLGSNRSMFTVMTADNNAVKVTKSSGV
jgi:hypothetical protein